MEKSRRKQLVLEYIELKVKAAEIEAAFMRRSPRAINIPYVIASQIVEREEL